MDSVNLIKGYGKVTNLEDQHPVITKPPSRKPLTIILAVSAVVILGILVALTIITSQPQDSKAEPPSSLASIKAICNTTLYPTTCLSTLSPVNKPDPEAILKQSLKLTIEELSKLILTITTTVINEPKDPALQDCKSQFEDALSRLKDSAARMEVIKPGEAVLDEMKISDIQTWVSAALSDEQTCLDGLEEIGSKVLEQVKAKMEKSKEMTSNSLAIVAHINTLFEKFDMKLH